MSGETSLSVSVDSFDFRPSRGGPPAAPAHGSFLRVVAFNCERGYTLDAIIDHLKSLEADVLLLQECDDGCKRTGGKRVAREIARALGMQGVYAVEFVEIDSPARSARLAGGGTHGNAVLTRFDIKSSRARRHAVVPFDWTVHGEAKGEPRGGGRVIVEAIVEVPGVGSTACYSVHLENYSGIVGRVRMFDEVMAMYGEAKARDSISRCLVGGDLNTLMHGLARFAIWRQPADSLRFRTFGKSEAQWWDIWVFANPLEKESWSFSSLADQHEDLRGLKSIALATGLSDPFDKSTDGTLTPSLLYHGKLDWLLSNNDWEVFDKGITGHGLSDHLCLHVDLKC
jgi:endonuclease/exonuclease/phosphatase family metal-dependent hydrolase